jgi:hypothetical protein
LFTTEAYVREKARALSAGLSSRLLEYVEEVPSGQSSSSLIVTVQSFLTEIEGQLSNTKDLSILRWFCRLIDGLSASLEWLDHAHTAKTPRACVEILRELSSVIPDGAEILVTPTTESNYVISDLRPFFENLTQALPESSANRVMKNLSRPLYQIHFPRVEKENFLNHALFGHEFGHPIVDEFFEKHETTSVYKDRFQQALSRVEKVAEFAEQLEDCADDVERTQLRTQISEKLAEVHRRALEELASDAIAAYLFGPSAIFAHLDFFIRQALDEAPDYEECYPPTRYRWRFMMGRLQKLGHIKALRELPTPKESKRISEALLATLTYLEVTVAETSDVDSIKLDPLVDVAYEWVEKTLEEATSFVTTRIAPHTYSANTLKKEVPALIEKLIVGVPPAEIGAWPDIEEVDWRSALCAGWVYALSQTLDPEPDHQRRIKRLLITQRLVEKGTEYILLRRNYNASKSPAPTKR